MITSPYNMQPLQLQNNLQNKNRTKSRLNLFHFREYGPIESESIIISATRNNQLALSQLTFYNGFKSPLNSELTFCLYWVFHAVRLQYISF